MENSVEFKAGDVVRLKSGGPEMTIGEIGTGDYEGKAKCQWFSPRDKQLEGAFYLDALEKIERSPESEAKIFEANLNLKRQQ